MFEKILGEAKGIFNTMTLIEFFVAVIYIVTGLIFFTNPTLSDTLVSIVTGVMLILNGAASIFDFIKKENIDLYKYDLIFGIVLILTGILACFLGNVLTIILGIYFIESAIQKISYGLLLKKFEEQSWLFVTVIGLLLLVIGIIAFFVKGEGVISGVGICLFGYGLIDIVNVILLRKRSKYFLA